MIYGVCLFVVEYITGIFFLETFGTVPWNYSHAYLNINGLIRLDYYPLWMLFGIVVENLHNILINK